MVKLLVWVVMMQKRRMKEKDVVRYLQEAVVHSRPEVLPARLAYASRKHETPVRSRCSNVELNQGISPLSETNRVL